MRLLKQIVCIVLIACLLTASALAEGLNTTLYQEPLDYSLVEDYSKIKRTQSLAAADGTLYVLTQMSLEKWTPGMAEPEILLDMIRNENYWHEGDETDAPEGTRYLNKLFTLDGEVYAIEQRTGQVYLAVDKTGALAMTPTVKLEGMGYRAYEEDDYSYLPELLSPRAVDGKLYVLVRDYMTGDYNKPTLMRYDLTTGAETELKIDYAKDISNYKDGKLLLTLRDEEHSWDEEKQENIPPTLAVLDPATDTVTELTQFDQGIAYAIAYSAAKDTLYYVCGSRVYGMPGLAGTSQTSAYLLSDSWGDSLGLLLDDDTYVVMDGSGLSVRTLDAPSLADGALTVYGDYGSRQHLAFAYAYPEIPVTLDAEYYDGVESLTNAMVSGQNAVDVLCLDSNYSPLDRLIEKGYAMDLSAYPELVARVDEMYPQFADVVKRDGKLYGVPYSLNGATVCFERENWEEIGLSPDDYPTTFMELLDFVENWEYDYADDYPDIKLFDDTGIKDMLLRLMMENYVAHYIGMGEPLTFDTELLRGLLAKLEGIDFTAIEPVIENDSDLDEYWNMRSLIVSQMGFQDVSSLSDNINYDFRVLALDEGVEPCLPCNLGVLIINPRTTRVDQAVRYVATYANNLERTGPELTLFPEHNEPVPNAQFDRQVKTWQEELERWQEELKTAAPEDVASIEDAIKNYEQLLEKQERYRYNVTAEAIAFYREQFAPYIVITGQTPLNTWDNEGNNDLYTQLQQYAQGAITLDQFIKAIDQRVRMMQLEDQ